MLFLIERIKKKRNERTREKMRKKLYIGGFEEKFITIKAKKKPMPMMQVMGPLGMDDLTGNIQDMLSGLVPKKTKSQLQSILIYFSVI